MLKYIKKQITLLKAVTMLLAVILIIPCFNLGAEAETEKPYDEDFISNESVYEVLEQYPNAFDEEILGKMLLRDSANVSSSSCAERLVRFNYLMSINRSLGCYAVHKDL